MAPCRDHPNAVHEENEEGAEVCTVCFKVVSKGFVIQSLDSNGYGGEFSGGATAGVDHGGIGLGSAENPLLNGTIIGGSTGSAGFDDNGVAKYKNRHAPMTSQQRALTTAFRNIETSAKKCQLPQSMVDRANEIFKEVYEKPLFKGCSKKAIAAASLYFSCREQEVPRTFREMSEITGVTKKEIGHCFKLIDKSMDTRLKILSTVDFVNRFCGMLGVTMPVQRAADTIARRTVDKVICPGRTPISVTAAAIYMASQASENKLNHKQIAQVTGVNPATIRQTYRDMFFRARSLFPTDFKFVTPIKKLPLP